MVCTPLNEVWLLLPPHCSPASQVGDLGAGAAGLPQKVGTGLSRVLLVDGRVLQLLGELAQVADRRPSVRRVHNMSDLIKI
jgi:hypothetical protein